MKTFKYLTKENPQTISDSKLNEYGKDGWELVSFHLVEYTRNYIYIFKKEMMWICKYVIKDYEDEEENEDGK